jgi:hypothetical protein
MPRYNRQEDFEAGVELVTPFFKSPGYVRRIAERQTDKEGVFFLATFSFEPRSVELHHLFSLGPVIYKIGDYYIEHTSYLEALGLASNAHYPSYEDDACSGYAALLQDLRSLLSPFFTGTVEAFSPVASTYMQLQQRKSKDENRKFRYWGSLPGQLKVQARELFLQKRYEDVVQIESQILFPDFLTEPEHYMFSLTRKHPEQ